MALGGMHAKCYNLTRDIIQGLIIEREDKLGNWRELGESTDHPIINSPSLTLMMLVTLKLKQQPLHKSTAWWEQHTSGQWM